MKHLFLIPVLIILAVCSVLIFKYKCDLIKAMSILASLITLGIWLYVYLFKSSKNNNSHLLLVNSDWYTSIIAITSFFLSFFYDEIFLGILMGAYFFLLSMMFNILKKSRVSYTFYKQYERIQKEFDNCINSNEAINNSLIEKHIDKMLDSLVENISSLHPLLLSTTNNYYEDNLKSFVNHIGTNSRNYLILCCHNKDIYSKTFSNIYLNIFSKINEDLLSPLLPTGVEKHKFKAPEFLSNEISKALIMSDGFNSQYNTCTQSWGQFLDNINEPIKDTKKNNSMNRFRRLFICSEVPKSNDEYFKKVVKWHNNNNWDIKYILDKEILPYDSDIQSKDFSIITIYESSYILRITGGPIKEYLYNIQVNYYLIELSHCQKEVKTYNGLFTDLWSKAQNIKLAE